MPHLGDREEDRCPSVLDLFAAPGGFSQGFREAGYRILAAVDIDKLGCETLRHNFPETNVIQRDIEDILPRLRGRVDVIIGGPPCQGFSLIGRAKINHLHRINKRERFIDDNRNRLYKCFVRTVKKFQPRFFVMENVAGIVSYDEGRVKKEILEDFKRIGYGGNSDTGKCDVEILNAADYGVPQTRKRAIFIGNRIGVKNPFPQRTRYDQSKITQTTLEENLNGLKPYRTVADAISDLPALGAPGGQDEMEYPPIAILTQYQKWARKESTKVYNHVSRYHSDRDLSFFSKLKPGQVMANLPGELPYRVDIFEDKVKKQRWDRPSSVILAHMQKDGLMYVHPDQVRSFTPREAARLQSFNDSFRFMGSMTNQFRQVGNAVPPILAEAIAMAIKPFIKSLKRPVVILEDVARTGAESLPLRTRGRK
jgi:DNA-cytosine methyltransferase